MFLFIAISINSFLKGIFSCCYAFRLIMAFCIDLLSLLTIHTILSSGLLIFINLLFFDIYFHTVLVIACLLMSHCSCLWLLQKYIASLVCDMDVNGCTLATSISA